MPHDSVKEITIDNDIETLAKLIASEKNLDVAVYNDTLS